MLKRCYLTSGGDLKSSRNFPKTKALSLFPQIKGRRKDFHLPCSPLTSDMPLPCLIFVVVVVKSTSSNHGAVRSVPLGDAVVFSISTRLAILLHQFVDFHPPHRFWFVGPVQQLLPLKLIRAFLNAGVTGTRVDCLGCDL